MARMIVRVTSLWRKSCAKRDQRSAPAISGQRTTAGKSSRRGRGAMAAKGSAVRSRKRK